MKGDYRGWRMLACPILAHMRTTTDQVVGMLQHEIASYVTARGAVSAILRPARDHDRRAARGQG